ncbi:MAG: hypothetical protein ACP5GT_05970 [Conexivisphaera sp.]
MIDLTEVDRHVELELIPRPVADEIRSRLPVLEDAISDIEEASSVPYPHPAVAPYLVVLVYATDVSVEGNVYARVIVRPSEERGLDFSVEFTAPLILYGSRRTIEAVAAHELTHYLYYAKRFRDYGAAQLLPPEGYFEAFEVDEEFTLPPEAVFRRRSRFVRLLRERMASGLRDRALDRRTERLWVARGLPVIRLTQDQNAVRIPVDYVAKFRVDEALERKLSAI